MLTDNAPVKVYYPDGETVLFFRVPDGWVGRSLDVERRFPVRETLGIAIELAGKRLGAMSRP